MDPCYYTSMRCVMARQKTIALSTSMVVRQAVCFPSSISWSSRISGVCLFAGTAGSQWGLLFQSLAVPPLRCPLDKGVAQTQMSGGAIEGQEWGQGEVRSICISLSHILWCLHLVCGFSDTFLHLQSNREREMPMFFCMKTSSLML